MVVLNFLYPPLNQLHYHASSLFSEVNKILIHAQNIFGREYVLSFLKIILGQAIIYIKHEFCREFNSIHRSMETLMFYKESHEQSLSSLLDKC